MVEGIILPYGDSLGVPDDQPLGVGGGGIVEGSEVGGEEGDHEDEGEGWPYAPIGHSLARREHSANKVPGINFTMCLFLFLAGPTYHT